MRASHQFKEKKLQIVTDKTILIYLMHLTTLLWFLQQNSSCLLYNVTFIILTFINITLTSLTFPEYLKFYFILPCP